MKNPTPRTACLFVAGALSTSGAASAFGENLEALGSLRLDLLQPADDDADAPASEPVRADIPADSGVTTHTLHSAFGAQGTWWKTFGGGVAVGDDDSNAWWNGYLGFDYFLVDDFALVMEFGGWFFDLDDSDDAFGGNFNLYFRWHFLNKGDWSMFIDGGAGLLLATDEVPDGGTEFNFMPRAGLGATWRLGDEGGRFLLGVRWQHISNARINGSDNNPGADAVMVYAGVMFPF